MSFSAETYLERPTKVPRLSFSIHHNQISSSFFIHQNISYLLGTATADASSTQLSYANNAALLHHHHHQLYAPPCRKGIKSNYHCSNIISNLTNLSNDQTSSASTCSVLCSLHPTLQPHLWRELPHELIERILAFLPISSIFRFSVVCKSWRNLLFSRPFLRFRSQIPFYHHLHRHQQQHSTYFLALNRSRYQQLSAYEVLSKKWYSFPLDFLPTVAYPISSAGGLICFLSSNLDTGSATLIVCNPLTKKWKELPSMICKRAPLVVSMIVDRKAMSYKILVAGGLEDSNLNRRMTEMYDSKTGKWVHCGPLPPDEDISRSMVEYCGYYLCLTRGPGSGLLAFNLQTQLWIKMKTGKIPGYSKFRHLVECRGSILVIGKAWRRYVLGLYIWCLDPKTLRWREVGKMPRAICDQFFSSPSECFYCTAQGHLIFFSRYFYNQGLVYNTVENSWQQVAGCPLLTHPLLLPFDPGLDPVE
ncbi:hypothetical protein L7F22_007234 [Adiantum nelumboides]|nr:hypothetical protein [Adiantum nelumboides]